MPFQPPKIRGYAWSPERITDPLAGCQVPAPVSVLVSWYLYQSMEPDSVIAKIWPSSAASTVLNCCQPLPISSPPPLLHDTAPVCQPAWRYHRRTPSAWI